jgi:tight adherence protein B
MDGLLLPAAVALVVFILVLVFLPKSQANKSEDRTQRALKKMALQSEAGMTERQYENISIVKDDASESVLKFLSAIPGGKGYAALILKSGLQQNVTAVLLFVLGIFCIAFYFFSGKFGTLFGLLIALFLAWFLPRAFLKRKIAKRNEQFVNMFPDAIDMIVRSVKSGHPLNTALRLIAENADPPIKNEFQIVVDEIAYGRSLTDALERLAKRIDEQDINFFVVVLTVQQETGGNLAEILSNLSNIIRKRKQLRLKIKAMTSEGRATFWILGLLPFFVFGAIEFTSPEYMDPLFETTMGQVILFTCISLIGLAGWIINKMVKIEI